MALFGLIFLVIVLVLIGVGIALGVVGSMVLAGLAGLGIVSSSVLIGLSSGRLQSGLRAFFMQCGVFSGLPSGAGCAWVYQFFWGGGNVDGRILLVGALGGAVAGFIVAMMLDAIIQRVLSWMAGRRVTIGT